MFGERLEEYMKKSLTSTRRRSADDRCAASAPSLTEAQARAAIAPW